MYALGFFIETDDPVVAAPLLRVSRLTVGVAAGTHDDPGLPGRIRGAWGREMLELSSTSREAQHGHSAFFPDKLGLDARFTPPYRIAVDQSNNGLLATLSLIGFADRFRDCAFDAFLRALVRPGLFYPERRAHLLSAPVWTRKEGVELVKPSAAVRLTFHAPLRLGPKDALGTRFSDVAISAAQQLAALSPWTGINFDARLSWWRDLTRQVRFDGSRLSPTAWEGYSSVNGIERAAGYLGDLHIIDPQHPLLALLSIGQTIHVGKATSKGNGRYVMTPLV